MRIFALPLVRAGVLTVLASVVCMSLGSDDALAGRRTTLPGSAGGVRGGGEPAFDGRGQVDTITEERIVVDDRAFFFSPKVSFHGRGGGTESRSWFRAGMQVGFMLDDQGRIVSVWKVD